MQLSHQIKSIIIPEKNIYYMGKTFIMRWKHLLHSEKKLHCENIYYAENKLLRGENIYYPVKVIFMYYLIAFIECVATTFLYIIG